MAYKIDVNQRRIPEGTVRYRFDVRIGGRRHRETVICKKSELKEIHRKWERAFETEIEKDAKGTWMFFEKYDEYCQFYLRYHCEGNSDLETYVVRVRACTVFRRFFDPELMLRDMKRHHIEDFVTWRRMNPTARHLAKVANASINREISVLGHFFNYCIQRDCYMGNNPATRMKLSENNVRRIRFTHEQFEELFAKAKGRGKIFTAVLLAVLGGLRRAEVFNLSWRDVDIENNVLHIRGRYSKGGKSRPVPMSAPLCEHMSELRRKEPHTVRIFEGWVTVEKLNVEWEKLRKQLTFHRIEDIETGRILTIVFHDLRHACATSLHEGGMSLDEIKEMLGHSSIRVTEHYYANTGRSVTMEQLNQIQSSLGVKTG